MTLQTLISFRAQYLRVALLLLLQGCAAVAPPDPVDLAKLFPDADRPVTVSPPAAGPASDLRAAPPPGTAGVTIPTPVKPAARRPLPTAAAASPPMPAPLADQPIEEVVVTPTNLTGYWRLTASREVDVDVGLFSGIRIRWGTEMRDRNICWLQQTGAHLQGICVSGGRLKIADGSVEADQVTMRWWSGPATIIFAGQLNSAGRVLGGFSGGVAGVSVTGSVPAMLSRVEPAPVTAESPAAALLRAVWEDVRLGRFSDGRYEPSAIKRVTAGLPPDLAALPPLALRPLGQIVIRWRSDQRETLQEVFEVETAADRQLCRIASNDRGQVVDASCSTLRF